MTKKPLNKKIIGLIFQQKIIRITLLLNLILAITCLTLFVFGHSFEKKIADNNKQIQDTKVQIEELKKIVNEEDDTVEPTETEDHVFASYEEIVPFINLLEDLFSIIDEESQILLKDTENQIIINRFADYEIKLKPGNKLDLFLKALDELYKSKYITKVTQLQTTYAESGPNKKNTISAINLTIRLYFE